MDNNLNNKPKAETGIDPDGNMQISSSGVHTPRRTPPRTPTRTPTRQGSRPPMKKKPVARTTPTKKPAPKEQEAREYSFATSALFNNEVKDRKTDATAVSEAKKITAATPIPGTDTKVMDTSGPRRAGRGTAGGSATRQGMNAVPSGQRRPDAPTTVNTAVSPDGAPATPATPSAGKAPAHRRAARGQTRPDAATRVTPAVRPEGKTAPKGEGPTRPSRKNKKPAGKETPITRIGSTFSAMNSVTKSLIYIAAVMLVSILLSYIIITNANDVFAFVKDEKTVSLTIEPGTDLNDLAKQLKEEGIIKHKNTFTFFIKFRNKDSDSYAPGTYTVSSTMSYDQIISAITPKVTREMVRITVPEGYTVEQIINLFVDKGIGTKENFISVINEGDFSDYWFVNEIPENTDRYYRLEGYLFPDTYYFYTDMTEDTIIRKFLDNFESKFTEEYRTDLAKTRNPLTGNAYTVDEIVTLGSIIQAEGKERSVTLEDDNGKTSTYVDYGLISGVFHNRMELSNPMKLQSDATTQFALDMEGKADAKLSDYTDANYTNPYNTYYCDGLPPGAVCNPGLNAISFALWPDNHQYYYFLSDSSGDTYFSKTVNEHLALVESMK